MLQSSCAGVGIFLGSEVTSLDEQCYAKSKMNFFK